MKLMYNIRIPSSFSLQRRFVRMNSRATTLGGFIAELMRKERFSNRALADAANISEGAVRNMLKFGIDPKAKDPDARTLYQVANALKVHPLRLYRLAGYLPTEPDQHSVRGDYVADIFDRLNPEKQDAVLGVLDAMANDILVTRTIQALRTEGSRSLEGLDLTAKWINRAIANELIVRYRMTNPLDVDQIAQDIKVLNYEWNTLPTSMRERIRALIQHKLALDYDPAMVESEWRS